MSRCFPYPPPGYLMQSKAAASMIESLKLQKVKKAKKERKEKKRDKKEEEKNRGRGEIDKKKDKEKRRHKDKRHRDDGKGQEQRKRRENEMEHLEKSSLTEEQGHPVGSQNSCDSSGSTLNHNKRHRTGSSYDGMENFGSTIKFLLPCQTNKHELAEKLGSATGGELIQEGNVTARKPIEGVTAKVCSTSATASQHLSRRSGREISYHSSRASEICPQNLKTNPPSICRSDSRYDLMFRDLFENWLPPPSCSEIPEYDDQDWLFSRKQNHNRGTKRIRAVADGASYAYSAPWSHVCHLPEVDLYALPFTVPF